MKKIAVAVLCLTVINNLCQAQVWYIVPPSGSDPRSTITSNYQGSKFGVGVGLPMNFQLEVGNDINLITKGSQQPIPAAVRAFRINGTPFLHNTGTNSLSVGADAGIVNTGDENAFVGFNSGISNTTGHGNAFLGSASGFSNNIGNSNVFIGAGGGYQNTSGGMNTFIGKSSGYYNTTGSANTFVGNSSGYLCANGHLNTFIGHFASGSLGLSNATAIGSNAFVSADNSLVLGNDNVNVGIGVSAPLYKLHVEGNIFAGNGDILVRTALNKLSSAQTGSFGSAATFDFNPTSVPGILMESGESGESGGFYADGDYAVIWSPGDLGRLLRVYDEDGMIERWYLDGNGNAFTNSDANKKQNVTTLENSLQKVKAMRGVDYEWKQNQSTSAKKSTTPEKNRMGNSPKTLGFIAQELETILPEAVATDEEGNKFVSYDALIPVLAEAIKEQQAQIDSLKSLIRASSKYTEDPLTTSCKLYQNNPNPFQENTSINFYLPSTIQKASVYIYNMQGKLLHEYEVTTRGESHIEITGGELESGMYLYSLIADGKEVDTRRMILSK